MRPATLRLAAIAAALAAIVVAGAAEAAVAGKVGQTGGTGPGASRGGENGALFVPQCYPTGTTYAVRCTKPVPTASAAESCSCTQVRIRNKSGKLVRKMQCSRDASVGAERKISDCGPWAKLVR